MTDSTDVRRPGSQALRKGRWSSPCASYFITLCTRSRETGLTDPGLFQALLVIAESLEGDAWLALRVLTLMPDHLHTILTLGERSDLSETIRRFKGRSAVALRRKNLAWQSGFFDHRIRPDEPLLPMFHYIYMNPYRKHLLRADEAWPYFFCRDEDLIWYQPGRADGTPYPEWLQP